MITGLINKVRYGLLVQNNILTINDKLERKILDYVVNLKNNRQTTILTPYSKYGQAFQCVTNLYTGWY